MAGTTTERAEELTQACSQAVSSGFAAADAGIDQTTAAVQLIAGAIQTERDEYGKVMAQATGDAIARGENFAGVVQTMPTVLPFTPEAREFAGKLMEGEAAFFQAWARNWTDYLAGVQYRHNVAARTMLEGNARALASSQEAMKSAVRCGEAFMRWYMEAARETTG